MHASPTGGGALPLALLLPLRLMAFALRTRPASQKGQQRAPRLACRSYRRAVARGSAAPRRLRAAAAPASKAGAASGSCLRAAGWAVRRLWRAAASLASSTSVLPATCPRLSPPQLLSREQP
eukprot:185069-Chlamydomonas_euryale.AAC.4